MWIRSVGQQVFLYLFNENINVVIGVIPHRYNHTYNLINRNVSVRLTCQSIDIGITTMYMHSNGI